MAKWQPPIPKGAIVEARDLGPGLALLGYCYDIVHTDGSLEINLHEVCPVLATSYATVRRWWATLQQMGIIEQVEEHGRAGIRARMNREWIDWRQLETRSKSSSNMSTIKETRSNMSTNNGQSRSETRSETRSNMSTNGSAYKVLITTDQASTQREREDRDRTARSHALEHPAVTAYRDAFPAVQLNELQEASISDLVGDVVERLECWRATVQDYLLSPHWKPENIGNIRSRFERKLREQNGKGNSNGTSKRPIRQNPGGAVERANWTFEASNEGVVRSPPGDD